MSSPTASPRALLLSLVGWVGFLLIVLLGGIVPIFIIPPEVMLVHLESSALQYFKLLAIQGVAAALFVVAALHILLAGFGRIKPLAFEYIVLIAFAAAGGASVFLSPNPSFGLRNFLPELLLILAAGTMPLFVTTPARARVVLGAVLFAGVMMALVPLLHFLGFEGVYTYVLGATISEIQSTEGFFMEGGEARAPFTSMTGNPEYTGGFIAAAFVLAGCYVMDGWGSKRLRTLPWWVIGLGALGIIGVITLASQTRSGLVVIAAGIIARWLGVLPIRGWKIAAGLCVVLAAFFAIGAWGAIIAAAALIIVVCVWQWRTGLLTEHWGRLHPWPRRLLIAMPIALLVGMVLALSVPQSRFRVVQVGERLVSATTSNDRSVRERLLFYMLAWEMMAQRPALGIGPGYYPANFHSTVATLSEQDPTGVMRFTHLQLQSWVAYDAHNDYFQIAAERGLIGLGLFLALLASLLARLARITRSHGDGIGGITHALLATIVGYLAMMLTSFPLHEASRLATFYVLVGLAFAAVVLHEKGEKTQRVELSEEC